MKETTKKGKEKINQTRQSSTWQKTKGVVKKGVEITGSHLATTKASIVLSNEEAELMENLKSKLNKRGVYPSKSEVLRAGLWSLRNKNSEELEEAVKDLFKVKQTRVL
jgi:Arc/MetJ-type ribon-helix-helix transcriptional regulator